MAGKACFGKTLTSHWFAVLGASGRERLSNANLYLPGWISIETISLLRKIASLNRAEGTLDRG